MAAVGPMKIGLWTKIKIMGWDGVYQVASTRIGQRAFSLMDRILCVFEAVNFYAAPKDQQEEARKHTRVVADERPLPWTLYLPVLIFCAIIREIVSVAAKLTRRKFNVIMAVYFIQSWRTTLKAIKIEGARIQSDPKRRGTMLPWPLRFALNLVIWGPLQFLTIVTNLIVGTKRYNNYATSGQPRSKRYLKKLKSTPVSECNTLELIDKLADEDDQDDPDFELKSTDLESDTDEDDTLEEHDEDVVANSDAEEDGQRVKENGSSPKEGGGENGHDNNHQNDGHHQENNHLDQQQQHHHQEHHHY